MPAKSSNETPDTQQDVAYRRFQYIAEIHGVDYMSIAREMRTFVRDTPRVVLEYIECKAHDDSKDDVNFARTAGILTGVISAVYRRR